MKRTIAYLSAALCLWLFARPAPAESGLITPRSRSEAVTMVNNWSHACPRDLPSQCKTMDGVCGVYLGMCNCPQLAKFKEVLQDQTVPLGNTTEPEIGAALRSLGETAEDKKLSCFDFSS